MYICIKNLIKNRVENYAGQMETTYKRPLMRPLKERLSTSVEVLIDTS